MAEFHVHQDENAIYKIYKLTGPTGKVYIGCTRMVPEKRWKRGHGYRQNRMLWADIEKYGWDAFEKEILCDKLLKAAAEKLEDRFITYYDSRNPEKGYNIFTGGQRTSAQMSELGKQHDREALHEFYSQKENVEKVRRLKNEHYAAHPETKKKLSDAIKAKFANDPAYRQRVYDATRTAIANDPTINTRISATLKETYRQHPELIENMRVKTAQRFAGHPEASKKTGAAIRAAYAADPGKRKRLSESMRAYYAKGNKPQTQRRACLCIDNGILYHSLTAAEKATGVDHSSISRCCKGKTLTAGGYYWRYAELPANEKTGSEQ